MQFRATIPALLVAAAGAAGAITFDPPVSYATPEQPAATALGDFNGDGAVDIAVTTDNIDKVSILTNNGDGTFAAAVGFPTGANTGPDGIAALDADGDGDLDLAVALHNANQVRIMVNAGGVFTGGASFATGTDPRGLIAADLNGDLAQDLVAVNRDGNSITVLVGGGGTFTATTIAVGAEPRGVAAGDWDGDGDQDLAVTSHDDRSVYLFSNSAGTFAAAGSFSVGANLRPDGLAAGDVDGDGDVDLAVATGGNGLNFVSIFFNGGGAFGGPVSYATLGENPGSIALADLDLDGAMDIAVVNQDSATLATFENIGGGVFGAALVHNVGTSPSSVSVGDVNSDGSADIVVAARDSNATFVLLNGLVVCAPDLEGDGDLDVFDYLEFQNLFVNQSPIADWEQDGDWDIFDFLAYQDSFVQGC